MIENNSPWHSVTLYGVSHSPWVQGVILALSYHDINIRLTSYPLSLRWFWKRGLVFPALQCHDGTIHLDSFQIYERLQENGYNLGLEKISVQERNRAQVDLEKLFANYALGRAIPGKNLHFFQAWSSMQEYPSTFSGPIYRAFLAYYFWLIIKPVIKIY